MLNRTFPARHRLIVKNGEGTRIDGKPFVGRWGPAIEELGFSLAGTILFAQHVLLAEGDADPVLIQALFQKLVEWRWANADLNAFSVISTGSSKNTDALIRILREGSNAPSLLVVVDGDEGGSERLRALKPSLLPMMSRASNFKAGRLSRITCRLREDRTLTLSLAMSLALSRLLAKANKLRVKFRNDFAKRPRPRATPKTR